MTLVESEKTFLACPFSNGVIAGLRDIAEQRFGYRGLAKSGVALRSLRPRRSIRNLAR